MVKFFKLPLIEYYYLKQRKKSLAMLQSVKSDLFLECQ